MTRSARTNCVDASALVKLYVRENGSDDLQAYMAGEANWYTTRFCFFEALSVLKRKRLKGEICEEQLQGRFRHDGGRASIRKDHRE